MWLDCFFDCFLTGGQVDGVSEYARGKVNSDYFVYLYQHRSKAKSGNVEFIVVKAELQNGESVTLGKFKDKTDAVKFWKWLTIQVFRSRYDSDPEDKVWNGIDKKVEIRNSD